MSDFLHTKHFSLDEARNTLPEAVPFIEKIVGLKHRLDEMGFDVYRHQYFGGTGPNGERFFPKELEQLVAAAQKLDGMGIQLKSLEQGLIDFPHIRSNGEEVYLCWKLGERDIEHWHRIPDGFAGRRPLEEL